MTNKKTVDEQMKKAITALEDIGLITTRKYDGFITLTEKGKKEFVVSGLQCLDEKKQYKDADEMRAAILISTILSTGKTEESLLLDMAFIFENLIDKVIPGFQEAIESIDFSQGDLCQPEK